MAARFVLAHMSVARERGRSAVAQLYSHMHVAMRCRLYKVEFSSVQFSSVQFSSVRASRGSGFAARCVPSYVLVALTPVGDMSNRQRVAVELRMGRFIP